MKPSFVDELARPRKFMITLEPESLLDEDDHERKELAVLKSALDKVIVDCTFG